MALSIKSEEADRLARELSRLTGETLTAAVEQALRERLEREAGRRTTPSLRDDIVRMQERIRSLPRQRTGGDETLIGYDESGLPS